MRRIAVVIGMLVAVGVGTAGCGLVADRANEVVAAISPEAEALTALGLNPDDVVPSADPAPDASEGPKADKGRAVLTFLDEPPFFRRRPVYIGDDVSDEAAFAVVAELGGIGIKIGPGRTAARHRVADNALALDWLRAVAAQPGH